jgi:hypothetical protein
MYTVVCERKKGRKRKGCMGGERMSSVRERKGEKGKGAWEEKEDAKRK